jgi:hypothetical protein
MILRYGIGDDHRGAVKPMCFVQLMRKSEALYGDANVRRNEMIILLPRDETGNIVTEGGVAQTEQEAWKKADALLMKNEQAVYVSLHQLDMTPINELWKTKFYEGWTKNV